MKFRLVRHHIGHGQYESLLKLNLSNVLVRAKPALHSHIFKSRT